MGKKTVLLLFILGIFILAYSVSYSSKGSFKEWMPMGYSESLEIEHESLVETQTVTSSSLLIKLSVVDAEVENRYWVRIYEIDGSKVRALSHSEKWGMGNDEIIWDTSNFIDRGKPKSEREIFARIGYASSNENITVQFYE